MQPEDKNEESRPHFTARSSIPLVVASTAHLSQKPPTLHKKMSSGPRTRHVRFLPTRREIIASAALGNLPAATSQLCAICHDEGKPLYDACGRNHGYCADCLINWVSTFDDQGKSMDYCPLCRNVICQAERRDDGQHFALRVAAARAAVEAQAAQMGLNDDDDDNDDQDEDENMDVDGENDSDNNDSDNDHNSNAGSDVESVASDINAQLEELDRFLEGADADLRRFWYWLRQVLAVILGMRILAWYGLWAPPANR
ncbi:hypothetical protein IWZ00DRAFT_570204 [Phyllosticta capitalensis]